MLGLLVLPTLIPALAALVPRRTGVSLRSHWRGVARDVDLGIVQSAFLLTFLAHQAWLMVDAIGRTVWRLFVRRKRQLEWVTTAQTSENGFDARTLTIQMAASALAIALAGTAIAFVGRGTCPSRLPFGVLWLFSPLIARWASAPPPDDGALAVTAVDARTLRLAARRTWRFFETYVTADDNFLPPDNFQEDPEPVVAHRTSPTISDFIFCPSSRRAISAGSEQPRRWRSWRRPSPRSTRWSGSAGISSTGTTPRPSSRSSRAISLPSTAATSPAT